MADEFTRCEVFQLVAAKALQVEDGNHGESRPRPGDFTDTGVAYIRAADMSTGVINFAGAQKINEVARARITKGIGRPGDSLLSHKGTVGKVALAPHHSPPFVCSPQTTLWRSLDEGAIHPGYLNQFLRSPNFQSQLTALKNNTDMAPYVSLTQQRAMTVMLPPIKIQQAIAEVLGALDDKIAANTRVAAAAEELFSARFAALIDSTKQDPLSSFADFVNGKAFTKDASGRGRVVIRIAELNSGLGGSTVYNDIEVDEKHVARPGDMLFSWSGSLTIHRWFRDEGIVNQHIFKVIPKAGFPSWLVWGLLERKIDEFRAIAADKATTMGHIQRRHLDEPVLAPAPGTIAGAHTSMSALWDSAHNARLENESLAATRDALLPALMSGCLRIEKPERGAIDRSRRTLSQGALKDRLPGKE